MGQAEQSLPFVGHRKQAQKKACPPNIAITLKIWAGDGSTAYAKMISSMNQKAAAKVPQM